jgi:hypothetical protein
MSWIRKNPFRRDEDPVKHMVSLLSYEADNSGTPFSEEEKEMLAGEARRGEPVPEDLRQRTKKLIEQILKRERAASSEANAKSFVNSVGWAGDRVYPNIVALTEEVITGGGFGGPPQLHGRAWIKDRSHLIGCALLAVLLMMLAILILGFILRWK